MSIYAIAACYIPRYTDVPSHKHTHTHTPVMLCIKYNPVLNCIIFISLSLKGCPLKFTKYHVISKLY